MTRLKELQNDIASIRLGQLLVCALIRFPVQLLLFRSPWNQYNTSVNQLRTRQF